MTSVRRRITVFSAISSRCTQDLRIENSAFPFATFFDILVIKSVVIFWPLHAHVVRTTLPRLFTSRGLGSWDRYESSLCFSFSRQILPINELFPSGWGSTHRFKTLSHFNRLWKGLQPKLRIFSVPTHMWPIAEELSSGTTPSYISSPGTKK